ncbi:hypothetical protein KSP40_PGU001366 [Platanthera guangdongensis]|uniref:Uncharacterized protein n=1 Tax=Platanthera guangdongensis TaxID=2320717 RepID=A0ABR2MMS0_9ASPA
MGLTEGRVGFALIEIIAFDFEPLKLGLDRDSNERGQDSNLQSSGHEPDESTNSSTPLGLLLRDPEISEYEIAEHLAVLTPLAYRSSVQKPRTRTCIEKDFPLAAVLPYQLSCPALLLA